MEIHVTATWVTDVLETMKAPKNGHIGTGTSPKGAGIDNPTEVHLQQHLQRATNRRRIWKPQCIRKAVTGCQQGVMWDDSNKWIAAMDGGNFP